MGNSRITIASARRALAAAILVSSTSAYGADYIEDETTAPATATEVQSYLEDIVEEERRRYRPFWRFEQGGPFWRDSQVTYRLRGYDFDRENDTQSVSAASALGGELSFRSGKWRDRLSVETAWYSSYGIDAPEDKGGSGLLGPGQSDLGVIGKAFVQVDFEARYVRLYRQDFMLPYMNRQDSRMIPNTHEAYTLAGAGERLSFIATHVTRIKRRDSEDFITMGEAAGVEGSTAGTSVAGLRYSPTENFDIGGMTAYTRNIFNTAYAETNWRRTFNENLGIQVSGQYTDQRSVGRSLLGDFSTHTLGIRSVTSYRNAVLTLSFTETDERAGIRSPFGGKPSYNSMMLLDFDRAGEKAMRYALSYHFGRIGLPGLSFKYSVADGWDGIDPVTGWPTGEASETDWTIDYRPEEGRLAGLWIRLRSAEADVGNPRIERADLRLIFNYTLTLF